MPATGVRLLCYLAGAPDYGRGAVFQRRALQQQQQQPVHAGPARVAFEGAFGDITPYSYASIPQAAPIASPPAAAEAASHQDNGTPQVNSFLPPAAPLQSFILC